MKKIIFSALILLAGVAAANAQTSSVSQNVTLTLVNSIDITITGGTGNAFAFGTTANYEAGITNLSAASFQVKSNRPYNVTVKSAAATFTTSAATPMPSTVLAVRLNGSAAAFGNLTTTAAALTSGARGANTFAIDYKANPGFLYDAGTCTMSVIYTATQQ